jgi:integrase
MTPIDVGKQAIDEENTDKLLNTVEKLPPLHRLVFYLEYDAIRRPCEIINLKTTNRYGNLLYYKGKTSQKTGMNYCVMTERLQQAWDDYLKNRPIPKTPEDNKYLILNEYGQYRGTRLKSRHQLTKIIREIAMYSQINIPNNEHPTNYLIKRTSITRQLKECPDPKIIQLQAGHTELATTMKYNRINEHDIKNYLNNFECKTNVIKRKINTRQRKTL